MKTDLFHMIKALKTSFNVILQHTRSLTPPTTTTTSLLWWRKPSITATYKLLPVLLSDISCPLSLSHFLQSNHMTQTLILKLSICWTLDSLQVKVHTASESCERETSTQWVQTVLVGGAVVGGRMHEKRGQQVKLGNMVKRKKEKNITQKRKKMWN